MENNFRRLYQLQNRFDFLAAGADGAGIVGGSTGGGIGGGATVPSSVRGGGVFSSGIMIFKLKPNIKLGYIFSN